MAFEELLVNTTCSAAADLSAQQYRFVRLVGARQVNVVAATGQRPFGVLQNKPELNQACTIGVGGVSKVEAGAAIAPGDAVTVDGTGRAVVAAGGARAFGEAIEGASAAGVIVPIHIRDFTA